MPPPLPPTLLYQRVQGAACMRAVQCTAFLHELCACVRASVTACMRRTFFLACTACVRAWPTIFRPCVACVHECENLLLVHSLCARVLCMHELVHVLCARHVCASSKDLVPVWTYLFSWVYSVRDTYPFGSTFFAVWVHTRCACACVTRFSDVLAFMHDRRF